MHSVIRRLVPLLAAPVLAAAAPAASAAVSTKPQCDPIDPVRCLLPWPNDFYTRADRHTPTGRRLALRTSETPQNVDGVHVAAGPYNASDGFSPGQTIVVQIPGFDTPGALRRTGAVPQTDLGRSFSRRAPVVVLDAKTLRRHLIWVELDSLAKSPADAAVLVHPGVDWTEGHRYIVAFRNLRNARGARIPAGPGFERYRDRRKGDAAFERRRPHMEALFRVLRRAGIARHSLNLTWDFTVASSRSLTGRMLSIRNRAFAALGDRNLKDQQVAGRSPTYVIDKVTTFSRLEEPHVARRVFGRVIVPCYLDRRGCPTGAKFALDRRGRPKRMRGNVYRARFECDVPRSATSAHPARPSLYGHGLFGTADEVESTNVEEMADEHDMIICGADWIGMADEDVIPTAVNLLKDLSKFPTLPDRLQQGFLDFMYIGRALIHPRGLGRAAAFETGGRSLIDRRHLYYYGNSQGGIAGGALTAVEPDLTRAALYVGAMNYSVLLTRSVDWKDYSAIMYPAYPDPLDREILLSMIGILWDRGEPDGYAQHMTTHPLPDTPAHRVLQLLSFGDHQVANVQTEVEARTIGSRLRAPAVDPRRHSDRTPYYGIPRIGRLPYHGPAALEVWDIGPLRPPGTCPTDDSGLCGTLTPPTANLPPKRGVDPHDLVINSEARVRTTISRWLEPHGRLVNECGRKPCRAAGWRGP